MAYHVSYWLTVQRKRLAYCVNRINRRMNNKVAYSILGVLFVILVYSTYRCNVGYSSSYAGKVPENPALPNFIVDFFDAYKEEVSPKTETMAEKQSNSCSAHFSLTLLSEKFEKCATASNKAEVDMDTYLQAWTELINFLNTMGKAFSFVSSDVVEKVGILADFRKSQHKDHYETIDSMIVYEKKEKLINYDEPPSSKVPASGSRTLLRLHRALKFLLLLFEKLAKNEDEGKVSLMGYKAYHASPMSKYHPWIIRKAVGVAVYMLPDRDKFIKGLCQDMSKEELLKITLETSESMDAVYEYTHALYSKYEITEIP